MALGAAQDGFEKRSYWIVKPKLSRSKFKALMPSPGCYFPPALCLPPCTAFSVQVLTLQSVSQKQVTPTPHALPP